MKDQWLLLEKLCKKAREITAGSNLPDRNAYKSLNSFLMSRPIHENDIREHCELELLTEIDSYQQSQEELEELTEKKLDAIHVAQNNDDIEKMHCPTFPQLCTTRFRRNAIAVRAALGCYE